MFTLRTATVLIVPLVLAATSSLLAQLSPADTDKRMRELNERVAKSPASALSTQPVRRPVVKPVPKVKVAVLKPNAPPAIQKWWDDQPTLKAEEIKSSEIAIVRQEEELISLSTVSMKTDDSGRSETDYGTLRAREPAIKAARESITEYKRRIRMLKTDPSYYSIPILRSFDVGNYGRPGTTFRMSVLQVVDEENVILRAWRMDQREHDGIRVWMKGLPTNRMTDDTGEIVYDSPIVITGTKQYTAALGQSVTCLLIEPLPIEDWVEFVVQ